MTVRPETFIGWHRRGFRLFWRWKSRRIGRPRIPKDLRGLILAMARDNPTWGQARIANELLVKLGIQVSPQTIQKYLLKDPNGRRRSPDPSQRWMNFVRNHAQAMLACDFFVSVTTRFQILYTTKPQFLAVLERIFHRGDAEHAETENAETTDFTDELQRTRAFAVPQGRRCAPFI